MPRTENGTPIAFFRVVERAGMADEVAGGRTFKSYSAALTHLMTAYDEDERDTIGVEICGETADGDRTYDVG